jgi:hypothetical protein
LQRPSLHFHLAKEEQSSVAAQVAPTEIRRNFSAQMGLKFKNFLITVCHSDIGFGWHFNTFNHNGLRRQCRYFISPCEIFGLNLKRKMGVFAERPWRGRLALA